MSNQPPENPYGNQPYGNQPEGGQPPYGGGSEPAYGQYPSGGSNPYGGAPQGGYGSPYDAGGSPYGAPGTPGGGDKGNDGFSIAGFVLSLTCCLSWLGIIFGILGLRRIKKNGSKGKWAAVSAIAIGSVLTVAAIGLGIFITVLAKSAITPDNAEVGQCTNITRDDNELSLLERDCDKSHDGEIVYVGEFEEIKDADVVPDDINDLSDGAISRVACSSVMDADDVAKIGDEYDWTLALEDPNDPDDSDPFVCVIERGDGDKIDAPVL